MRRAFTSDPAAPPPEGTGACYGRPVPAPGRVHGHSWLRILAWSCLAAALLTNVVVILLVALFASGMAHAQVPPDAARYRADLTRAAHAQWGLDAPVAALAAQVHQESGWNPLAVSHVGAAGMAQFMPATARWWCEANQIPPAQCQPTNPTWALRALVGYDRYLFVRTPEYFNPRDRLWVALRGYNGGLGHWNAEAAIADKRGLAVAQARGDAWRGVTREDVDAACGTARRHPVHCKENLGYPQRILNVLQPRYATWGLVL